MKRYDRLGKNLAQIGYINQPRIGPGTIGGDFRTKRIPVDSKGRQKNHPVTLISQQFVAMKQAVQNERKLWKMIQQMETVSRQILFGIPTGYEPT